MNQFLQQLLNGLTLGAVYALVALGFTLIFGVLKLIAFAQGGIYMLGCYTGLIVVSATDLGDPVASAILAVVAAAAVGAVLNLGVDRVAYRPIRHSRPLMALVSGIGMYTFIENGAGLAFGREPRIFPGLLPTAEFHLGPATVTAAQICIIAAVLVLFALVHYFVERTGTGLAMRASAERPTTAGLMGIRSERVIMITFMIAGALSGIAGVLVGSYIGVAAPVMGFLVGIKAFAAAVIGGIGSISRALAGGLVIGVIEAMGAGYISSAWSDALVFVALVLVLLVRPNGIFGSNVQVKV